METSYNASKEVTVASKKRESRVGAVIKGKHVLTAGKLLKHKKWLEKRRRRNLIESDNGQALYPVLKTRV